MTAEEKFKAVVSDLDKHEGVEPGSMMSAPGIQYNGKNFAFFHKDQMVFRLGRDWKPEEAGIQEWSHLSPFKNKPPLYDWFCITEADSDLWPELATRSLSRIMAGK
jgi:hypothetical protein